ncbi:winged helix-turn-helix domain-containing protein [Streptomyces sp. NPDC005479]|uniref:winged helix-turn-helix domain-containing protein n=1 Tax=Streptomyces sp. NPDC005479 TaxID=3154879 RepID=UPI0033A8578A
MEGLRSAGPANSPTIADAQFSVLEEELGKGPATHGFEDERWTLVRVQVVIRRRLRVSLWVATVWRLLKRHGWSWQDPARRALERDQHAVELWKKELRPRVKGSRRPLDPLRGRGLTTIRLPPYAPDLNPVEAVWSLVRRAMANTAFTTPDDLDRKLRSEVRRIQLRPRLINGCLTATRLAINPPTPP